MSAKQAILIIDDEPHMQEWLVEYLEAKGYDVLNATNVDAAMDALNDERYRIVIVDLNIPVSPAIAAQIQEKGPVYVQYKGLFVAEYARNRGHRDRQVIIHSVHDSEDVRAVCERTWITYLTKGRPRAFKEELDAVLAYDPTAK